MKKFLYSITMVLVILVLIGIIVVLYTQYKILTRGEDVAEEFIKSEQKRKNLDCRALKDEFKNFVDNQLQQIIKNENALRKGEADPIVRDLVKGFNDKLSTCSLLYVYDKHYRIGETGDLEYISNIQKEYIEIYTLIGFPESDSVCDEDCKKEKMIILEKSYSKLYKLLK